MATPRRPNAEEVAYAFKHSYYYHLQNFPELLHHYYKDNSKISRPQLDGTMRVSTSSDIDEKDLKILTSGGFDSVVVTSVMSQDSLGGGVIVSVDGYFMSKERPARNFIQSFFLAPQENGYFVLSDFFKFVDDLSPKANDFEPDNGFEKDSEISFGSVGQSQGQDSQSCDDSGEIKADSVDDSRNGNSEVYLPVVAEGEGICIQNIPLNVTIGFVKEVLKKFGSIKSFTVRSAKNCFDCLVEFEESDAAENIIKASPLLIDGHISQAEKKLPYCESLSAAGPENIERGEEVRESINNPFRNWKNIMEEVRGTDVWEKLTMRGTRVYDVRNWENIMDQVDTAVYDHDKLMNLAHELIGIVEEIRGVYLDEEEEKEKQKLENLREEERKKIEEEEGRQYKQRRYRSQQMKETQRVDQIQEEEEEEEQNDKVESKIQEEEGRQYKQSRFRSKQMKEETQEVGQIQEEEEEQNEKVESKLQEEAEETEVDFSCTFEDIMEFHRRSEEEEMKKIEEEEGRQYKQNRYRSEQVKETQEVRQIPEEVEEEEEQNEKVQSKLQEVDFSWSYEEIMEVHRQFEEEHMKIEEEEGRQYNQNRYRSPEMKETQEVAQIPEEEEETEKVESKLQEEGKEKVVDFSWTYELIMEEHRVFEEEHEEAFTLFCKRMKQLQDEQETVNQNLSYIE